MVPLEARYSPFALHARRLAMRRGGVSIVEPISFSLCHGDILALYGHNGAGKTTLLRLLAGFLRPTKGTLCVPPGLARHYIGHAPGVSDAMSLAENLEFWFGYEEQDALAEAGLAALADMPARVLSAGQRRRLAFTRLIVSPRPLWLLDEPLAELDKAGTAWLTQLIRAHCHKGGAVVMASHRPLRFATKTLQLGAIPKAKPKSAKSKT